MLSQRTTLPQLPAKNAPAWVCGACHNQVGHFEDGLLRPWISPVLITTGAAAIFCPRCGDPVTWDYGAIPEDPRFGAGEDGDRSFDDLIAAMEARWSEFRSTKLRERGTIAVGLRFDVFMRDGFRCRYCGVSVDDGAILHADHVIPESKGGPTTMENLVTACIDCNLGKSDKDLSVG